MKRAITLVAVLAAGWPTVAMAQTDPAKIYCGGGIYDFLEKPRFCSTLQPDGTIADSIALHTLRWSHWGRSSTTAVGRTRTKTYDPWIKVRVRAYRRVWSDCSHAYLYTRLRTTTKYGRNVWKMPNYCTDVGGPGGT